MKFHRNKKLVDFVHEEPKAAPRRISKNNHLQNISIPGISITRVSSSSNSSSSSSHPMLTPPDTRNYGRGMRQGVKNSIQVSRAKPRLILPKPLPGPSLATVTLESDSDDDDIEVISEKITTQPLPPKLKIVKVKSSPHSVSPSLKKLPSSLVKVSLKSKPSSEKKKIFKAGPASTKPPVEVSDPFAEDEDLTCRVCNSAFWFRSQIVEHLSNKHNIQDPEAFLREKRSRL